MSSSNGSAHDQGSPTHPPRSSTGSEESMMSIESSISEIAQTSIAEVKTKLSTASDSAHSAWEQVYSMVTGTKNGESSSPEDQPDDDELERINSLEKERIAEFLREKYRSDAHTRSTQG